MPTKPNVRRVQRLRERDGDSCWLCDGPIDFEAKANSPTAWSVEHLLAKKHDGCGRIENLVLCHPPCNRELRDRSLPEKIKHREERLHERYRKAIEAVFCGTG